MKILHKNKALLSLIAFLAIIFSIGMAFDYKAPEIEAGTGDNISGWAWSETIGWISFNCTDTGTCGTSDYGVNIDFVTNAISGRAWSENIGWLSFESGDLSGCPAGTCGASIDTSVDPYELRGWGRVLSMSDGWVSLNCKTAGVGVCGSGPGQSDYKVTMNPTTGKFSGWAWGSDVIGWIDFAPSSAVLGGINVGYNNASSSGTTACNDVADNDGDGLNNHISVNPTNYDPGCLSASDTSEEQVPNYSVLSSNNITTTLIGTPPPVTSDETTISISMINKGDPLFSGPIQLSVSDTDIPSVTSYNFDGVPSATYNLSEAQYSSGVPFSVTIPGDTTDVPYTIVIRATGGGVSSYVNVLLNSDNKAGKFRER